MNERVIFFIVVFGIAILLIAVSLSLYLTLKEKNIFEFYDCYVFSIFWTPTTCTTKNAAHMVCTALILLASCFVFADKKSKAE